MEDLLAKIEEYKNKTLGKDWFESDFLGAEELLVKILQGLALGQVDPSSSETSIETFEGATLEAEAGRYYRADAAVGTLAITLPAIEDVTKVTTVVLGFTTGATPAITFTSADSKTIRMADGFGFEAEKTYEVNALYNGAYWSIAGIVIAPAE